MNSSPAPRTPAVKESSPPLMSLAQSLRYMLRVLRGEPIRRHGALMKSIEVVMQQKAEQLERVKREIEALRIVIPLMYEDGDKLPPIPPAATR